MKREYRHIFFQSYYLAKANFKVRNEGSYLGILWYLLNPLCFFLIILYLRGVLFSSEGIHYYPAYLLLGLIMMNFFNQNIGASASLIRSNSTFIKTINIRYEVFVLSTLFQVAFSHAFELLLFAVLLVYLHISLVGILFYLAIFAFFVLFVLGLSFLFATIGLYFSDLGNVWAIAAQLLLFITPVFYAVRPGNYLYFGNLINPLFYFLTAARDVAIYGIFPPAHLALALPAISVISLSVGFFVFERYKGRFAELV